MTLTLTDDLDFGTKEKVLSQSMHNVKYESPITYQSKAMANVKVFADKHTDRPNTICPRSIDAVAYKRQYALQCSAILTTTIYTRESKNENE